MACRGLARALPLRLRIAALVVILGWVGARVALGQPESDEVFSERLIVTERTVYVDDGALPRMDSAFRRSRDDFLVRIDGAPAELVGSAANEPPTLTHLVWLDANLDSPASLAATATQLATAFQSFPATEIFTLVEADSRARPLQESLSRTELDALFARAIPAESMQPAAPGNRVSSIELKGANARVSHPVLGAAMAANDQVGRAVALECDPASLTVEHHHTIHAVERDFWNRMFGAVGACSWDAMALQEQVFRNRERREHNWNFDYVIVRRSDRSPVAASFFTTSLIKDDMFVRDSVSRAVEMRRREGATLGQILNTRMDEIEKLAKRAEASPGRKPEAIRARLAEQVAALMQSSDRFDQDRLAQEALLIATKADIREELDRIASHIAQARDMLGKGGPVGRRLDFLAQEFNREVNTCCSKSNDIELTNTGLEMKNVVEQFREQVQNLE
jgi:hypothetical protein